MADEATLEEASPSEEKKQRGMLVPLLATGLGSAVVASGIMFGVMSLMGSESDGAAAGDGVAAAASGDASLPAGAEATPSTEVVPLKKFTTNLKDGSGGRKIALDISLEGKTVDGAMSLADSVAEREAAVRDTVNFLLMDYTYQDLRGHDGMRRLRDEIHRKIDIVLAEDNVQVSRVYFTDVVVQ